MTPMPTTQGRETAARRGEGADRPLIFSAPMVRAIMASRKSMTRRVLKPQPTEWQAQIVDITKPFFDEEAGGWGQVRTDWARNFLGDLEPEREVWVPLKGLRFAIGDLLWVKEVIACGACAPPTPSEWAPSFWRREQGTPANPNGLWYAADGLAPERTITSRGPWISPIFMPRWASRLTLIVESVRVERLGDISEEDAKAEGLACLSKDDGRTWKYGIADRDGWPGTDDDGWPWSDWNVDPRRAYARLWDGIHGKGAFEASPWVAALTFRVIPQNIDRLSDPLPTGADAGEGRHALAPSATSTPTQER